MADTKIARIEDIGRGATIKIAASNATEKSKAAADYVCDGEDDHIEINAAIDELGALGGCVELSEGTFYMGDADISFQYIAAEAKKLWLKGMGNSTVITKRISDPSGFRGMYVGIPVGIPSEAYGIRISDISFEEFSFGIFIEIGRVFIDNCSFLNCTTGVYVHSMAKRNIVTNNYFKCTTAVTDLGENTIINFNQIDTL